MTNRPSESLARRLLRSAAHYSAGQGLGMLASIARVAIAARVLSAEANGVWLGLQLVLSYGANLHLGALFGMFRNVPLLTARGNLEGAAKERETSFTFVIVMTVVTAPGLLIVTHFINPAATTGQVVGTGLLVALTLIRSYYNTVLKAESQFRGLAKALAVGAVASVLSLGLIVRFGLNGLIAATGIQLAVELLFYLWYTPTPSLRLSRAVLFAQVRVGAVTVITSLGTLLLTTIDRTVMLQRLGPRAAGLYYLGANVMVLMPVVAALPAAVLTPQFFERVGRGEDVGPLIRTPVRLASLVFGALVAVGAAGLPPAVAVFWPSLVGGIEAAQIALFATFPLVLAGLVTNVYYAHNRQGLQVGILLLSAAVGYGFAHLGVSITQEIVGAAAGAAVGLFVYFPACTVGAFWVIGSAREGVSVAARAALPLLYAVALTVTAHLGVSRCSLSPVIAGLVNVGIVSVGVIPLIARARRVLRDRL